MVVDTPKAMLEDRAVEIEPPRASTAVQRWWQFWKR
jgi:hypothetical protein